MGRLFIFFAGLFLQACSTSPVIVGSTSLSDQSPNVTRGIDATVQVYVPNQVKSESFMLDFANSEQLQVLPGQDLTAAALDVSEEYFLHAVPLDIGQPADFILKLNAESFMTYRGHPQVKGVLTAELLTMDGESVYTSTISRSEKNRHIDQHAYYSVYAGAVRAFMQKMLEEKSSVLDAHLASYSASTANPVALIENEALDLSSTGSGFFINRSGHVVTNQHVVEQCVAVTVALDGETFLSQIVSQDREKDIAVLETGLPTRKYASFNADNSGERLGENILTLGYPLYGVLSSSINLTTGNISSMLGMKDDENVYQITAPIQAGNSGGPVLNQKGLVAGVVQSKLNALELSRFTGDLAQNVNFAIKSSSIKDFLASNRIDYHTRPYSAGSIKTTVELANEARDYTVQIKCHG